MCRWATDWLHVRCFVDDRLVTDGTEHPQPATTLLFASASQANVDHAVIGKVVNLGNDASSSMHHTFPPHALTLPRLMATPLP